MAEESALDTSAWKAEARKKLVLESIPGCEYWLYLMIRSHLGLNSLRHALMLGLRCIYAMGHSDELRPLLLHIAHDLHGNGITRLESLPKERRPIYQEWTWGIDAVPNGYPHASEQRQKGGRLPRLATPPEQPRLASDVHNVYDVGEGPDEAGWYPLLK